MTYTEQDLRAVLRALESDAPNVPDILAATYRRHRRRTTRRRIAGMAAVAVLTGALMAGAVTVPNLVGSKEQPATTLANPLTFRFAVDDIPGARAEFYRLHARMQSATVVRGSTHPAIVDVFDRGGLTASQAQFRSGVDAGQVLRTGEAVDVNGKPGWYFTTNPLIGHDSASGPVVAWEYAPDSWAMVRGADQATVDRGQVLSVARAVRFDRTTPCRVPFRVGYLPSGLRSGVTDATWTMAPGLVLTYLQTGDTTLKITASRDSTGTPPAPVPPSQHPREEVDLGPFTVLVETWTFGKPDLPREEVVKVIQSVSRAGDWDDLSTWLAADEAIPIG